MLSQALTNHKIHVTHGSANRAGSLDTSQTGSCVSGGSLSPGAGSTDNHRSTSTEPQVGVISSDNHSHDDSQRQSEATKTMEQTADSSGVSKNQEVIDEQSFQQQWGYNIDELFDICLKFYKNNESKAFHPSFDQRNRLNALIIQAKHGKYEDRKMPEIGVLDLVGKNRRHQWSLLGDMSKLAAKHAFIVTIDEICPLFKAFVEAIRLNRDSVQTSSKARQEGKNEEQQQPTNANSNRDSENGAGPMNEAQSLLEQQNKAIYDALCRQTHEQFSKYACNQYPNDQAKREFLVEKLQLQYYNQYMQQVYQQQQQSAYSSSNIKHQEQQVFHQKGDESEMIQIPERAISSASKIEKKIYNNNNYSDAIRETQQRYSSAYTDSQSVSSCCQQDQQYIRFAQPASTNSQIANHQPPQQTTATSLISCHINRDPTKDGAPQAATYSPASTYPDDLSRGLSHISLSHPLPPPPTQSRQFPQQQQYPQHQQILQQQQQQQQVQEPHQLHQNQQYCSQIAPQYQNQQGYSGDIHPSDEGPGPNDIVAEDSDLDDGEHEDEATAAAPQEEEEEEEEEEEDEAWQINSDTAYNMGLNIASPSLWTRNTIDEFKESIRNEGRNGIFVVQYGESVTVRAPTHRDGKSIYWEFATDNFDIGFGVLFQYDKSPIAPLSLEAGQVNLTRGGHEHHDAGANIDDAEDEDDDHITSTDDDDEDEDGDLSPQIGSRKYDVETGGHQGSKFRHNNNHNKGLKEAPPAPLTFKSIVVIPIYRRDSHEEVYAGRHDYPGQGVYLLKFDNTYSKLRSKTVYYRVCYYPHYPMPTSPATTNTNNSTKSNSSGATSSMNII